MQVILRPIGWNKWSGILKYKNCFDDLGPYLTRSGALYTGLTLEDEKRLGSILGLDLSRNALNPFWTNFRIRTSVNDIIFNTEDPLDELKYLFAKGHKRVKTSLLENKATADFVLINRDEEAKVENSFNRIKREAIKEFDKLTATEIRKALRLFGYNADSMSAEVAENRLYTFIEANPQKFMDRWVNNKSREIEALIETAISKNIIRRNKNIYKYGSEIIGNSLEDTVNYLMSPNNQDIRLAVMNACDTKDYYVTGESSEEDIEKSIESEMTPKQKGKVKKEHVANLVYHTAKVKLRVIDGEFEKRIITTFLTTHPDAIFVTEGFLYAVDETQMKLSDMQSKLKGKTLIVDLDYREYNKTTTDKETGIDRVEVRKMPNVKKFLRLLF